MSEFSDKILEEFMSGAYMGEPDQVAEQWEKCVVPFLRDPKDKDTEIERLTILNQKLGWELAIEKRAREVSER